MRHIFIIGSKGIPAEYGGFETFAQELATRRESDEIHYHVACMECQGSPKKEIRETQWEGISLFYVPVRNIGSAKAVFYDVAALRYCVKKIREDNYENAVVYILASRIGPFIAPCKRKLSALGARLFLNPDGHEWERAKWNAFIKWYWKISERNMIRYSDLVICDSREIRRSILERYRRLHPSACFLPYGADILEKVPEDQKGPEWEAARQWLKARGISPGEYYLVVGRFVPENNYEFILKEFMESETKRSLLVISNADPSRYFRLLREKTGFTLDRRICFAGTLYDRKLLMCVRTMAFAYIHGHSVGGTNPSLLEALGSTKVNLLFKVSYNEEVAQDAGIYWDLGKGSLKDRIALAEGMDSRQREDYGRRAKKRISMDYSWEKIVRAYEELFLLNSRSE